MKLKVQGGTNTVLGHAECEAFSACNKRTSRRKLSSYGADNEQLTHRTSGPFPARDKRTSRRVVKAEAPWSE